MSTMDRITAEYGAMTKSHRKIVHHLQLNKQDLLFDSLAVFAQKVGSSEATVVRFAQQLGYSGYAQMQKDLHDELLAQVYHPAAASVLSADGGPFHPLAAQAAQRMTAMYDELDMAELDSFCRIIMEAESVLIVGYMDSFGVAAHTLHLLDGIRSNVDFARLLIETNEVYRRIHKNAAVLVVSFAPHYKYTHSLLELAVQRGCTTLLITDSKLNPLAQMASHVLCAKPFFDIEAKCMDISAPMHLIYSMVRRMTLEYSEQVESYCKTSLKRFEEYLE